ncbi:pentapeptide repeat-containing protein [Thalassospira sp. TSL5-1]|uniref:pentapeptide repeat-containing protein n=1 Tax=Thalassospira sp. TSL5-1 TaxID=1544451 RepID=UPI0009F9672C|nr:pentapeptide repeat-containing protein [Thalassospira sp. TSL5-1]
MSSMSDLSILYADYSPKAASLVREALQPLNISAFYTSETQEETLAMAHRYRPRLVMVSLQLDGYQGIKTIGYLRALSRNNDPYFNQVPVLLGAKSLTREAMRHAVAVGIEGVFRQPVNPDRLNRIVNTVVSTPRRFVLDGDYFGPSPQKTPQTTQTAPADAANAGKTAHDEARIIGNENDDPANQDLPVLRSARQSNAGVILRPTRKTAPVSRPPVTKGRSISGSGSGAALPRPAAKGDKQISRLALSDEDLVAPALDQPQPKTLDASDLVRSNQEAAKSALPVETASLPKAKATPADEAGEEDADEGAIVDDQNLVEIDIKTALLTHKTWVDTGGKEGQMVSFEHADLRHEDLEGIDLTRCVLPKASLQNANCEGTVLRRCDLTMANFTGANLKNAILAASRLNGANFKDARLTGTVFLGADLTNANLRGAKLPQCDFSGCNLSKTDLRDADLSSAKGLFSEQIQRARINANTRLPRDMKLKTV